MKVEVKSMSSKYIINGNRLTIYRQPCTVLGSHFIAEIDGTQILSVYSIHETSPENLFLRGDSGEASSTIDNPNFVLSILIRLASRMLDKDKRFGVDND